MPVVTNDMQTATQVEGRRRAEARLAPSSEFGDITGRLWRDRSSAHAPERAFAKRYDGLSSTSRP
jgi:hypothetical protein